MHKYGMPVIKPCVQSVHHNALYSIPVGLLVIYLAVVGNSGVQSTTNKVRVSEWFAFFTLFPCVFDFISKKCSYWLSN